MVNLKDILKKPAMVLGITAGILAVSSGILTCLNTGLKKQNIELYRSYVYAVKDYVALSKQYRLLNTEKMMDSINLSIDYARSIYSSAEEYSELKHKNDSLMKRCLKNSQEIDSLFKELIIKKSLD